MSYMTIEEQIASHLAFLKTNDFCIENLSIDQGFIRCQSDKANDIRGEWCYQTKKTILNNGKIGLMTWMRGKGGIEKIHKTYGLPEDNADNNAKVQLFWQKSSETGVSNYLLKKGVGYYGIRFRENEYGKIAVIPLRTIKGELKSYQLINPDGSKRFARDISTQNLLHKLQTPINGCPIGLCESYITAASCFEVTGIAMITAFSGENLKAVAIDLRKEYPQSHIIIFGDNDRHLQRNKGVEAAISVLNTLKTDCQIAIPEFDEYPAHREFSDWNDFIREKGVKETRKVIEGVFN